jgi:hypothetical protein
MPGAKDERIVMIAGTPGDGIGHSEREVAICLAAYRRALLPPAIAMSGATST